MQLKSDMTVRQVQVLIAPPPKKLLTNDAYVHTWPEIKCIASVLSFPGSVDEKAVFEVLNLNYVPFDPARYMVKTDDAINFYQATITTIRAIHGPHTF